MIAKHPSKVAKFSYLIAKLAAKNLREGREVTVMMLRPGDPNKSDRFHFGKILCYGQNCQFQIQCPE